MLGAVLQSVEQYRWRWTLLAVGVGLAPVAWNYGIFYYRRYRYIRWGFQPGAISGYLARILENHSRARRNDAPVRVYMDGCFDMMHYGHANALRQARACGDVLVVGLIPDHEIEAVKGPPVMNNEERLAMVESVKWVDEVITNAPYEITEGFMAELFEKHHIDVIVHGDDPCLLPDGTDAYAAAKRVGRFVTIKRTEGVSTTDLVGRMLMCVRGRDHPQQTAHMLNFCASPGPPVSPASAGNSSSGDPLNPTPARCTRVSHFLPTSRRFVQFSSGKQASPGSKIVYLDGAFDMFHAGHVAILKKAKALGDFLLVGVHNDEVVTANRGMHHPIQTLHERALSLLSCRYVDEVVMGTPYVLTKDMIITFNISTVVAGTISEPNALQSQQVDPYQVPKDMGIFQRLESPSSMTTSDIIQRIYANRDAFETRNAKKAKSERMYYEKKEYVNEY